MKGRETMTNTNICIHSRSIPIQNDKYTFINYITYELLTKLSYIIPRTIYLSSTISNEKQASEYNIFLK